LVGIEEVAIRNQFRLYPTTQIGQFKAHCPACHDKQRQFHLYVSSVKDTFFCQKCGTKGGVIAFHSWLKGISFQAARHELYPAGKRKFPRHPAEQLTYEQREEAGFTTHLPSPFAPKAFTQKEWNRYRRRTLDWIWREWREYEQLRKEQDERLYRLVHEGMGIEVSGQRTSHPEDLTPTTTSITISTNRELQEHLRNITSVPNERSNKIVS